jgi:hypothetical protein
MRLSDKFAVGAPLIGTRILWIIGLTGAQAFAIDQVLADIVACCFPC